MGSGMILDTAGHILTNNHVIAGVDEIKVQLADKRQFEAEIVGTDPKSDVAVIRIKGKVPSDLPVVELGDSGLLQPGDVVLAIGAPFGLPQTVTHGIISATGRADVGIADFEDFLQTDAPVNPGNSGGPLVNMHGEVIGMNSAIATNSGQYSGVSFAIPVNMIKEMLPTLLKGATVTRGMLGVVIQDMTKDLAKQFHLENTKGALISQVNEGSPAQKAGLKAGDVVIAFDGKSVEDMRELRNRVAATKPGTRAKVSVLRRGNEETFTVDIGTLTAEASAGPVRSGEDREQFASLGLNVQDVTPDLAQQFDLGAQKGVLIASVEDGSPAALADLRAGDLIVEVDRERVSTVAELQRVLTKDRDSATTLLLVKRQGGSLFVVLQKK